MFTSRAVRHASSASLAALLALASSASADPEHQGQTGTSTIATPGGRPAQPNPLAPTAPPPPPPTQPVNYTPPPSVGGAPPPVVVQPQPYQQPYQPAPTTYPAPPPVSQQQRNADARPGLFGSIQGGASVPVQGDLGEFASVGGVGVIQGGYELPGGLSLRIELGFRTNSVDVGSVIPDSETALFYGIGARYTIARSALVHPFVEAYADLFSPLRSQSTGSSGSSGTSATTAGTGFSAGGGGGIEFDLNEQISLQVGVRFDAVLSNASGNALTGGLTHVLLGGSYYY